MSEADAIIDLYERHADAWAAGRTGPVFEAPWLDRFLSRVGTGKILDIGCGSGWPIAQYFLKAGFDVHGVDSSPALIGLCRKAFPASTWEVGDMRSLDIGQTFDGLIAWHSLFHLTPADQREVFPLFRKHAKPGAPLMFTSGPAHGEVVGQWQDQPLYHGSLGPDEYTAHLSANGFDLVDHVVEDAQCGHATIWLACAR